MSSADGAPWSTWRWPPPPTAGGATSGLGPSVTASTGATSRPALLVVLGLVLVADLAAIAGRRLAKRRVAREAGTGDPTELLPASA